MKEFELIGGPLAGKRELIHYDPRHNVAFRGCFDAIPIGDRIGLYKGTADSGQLHWILTGGTKHSEDPRECRKLNKEVR